MDFKETMKKRIVAHTIMMIFSLLIALSAYVFLDGDMCRNFMELGIVLAVIKAIRITSCIITLRSDKRLKHLEISEKDERNRSIALKAKGATYFISVFVFAMASYAMVIAGYSEIAKVVFYCLCFMLVIYYITYLILQRKY